jgi:hypothetical protein
MVNSGNGNSGNMNSGDRNSGNMNSGDLNSGNMNSGNLNSGNMNSGDLNIGGLNSGNMNSGDRNSGNRNSGDRNSGNLNSGNWNSGVFNSNEPFLRMFNKETPWKIQDWLNSKARELSWNFTLTDWIDQSKMTDKEKQDNPSYKTTGGYLKRFDYKEAWKNMWDKFTEDDKKEFYKLPKFDADIFFEITGINVKENSRKKELLLKADELIVKANELKSEAEKL